MLIITQIFQRLQNKLKFVIYSTCKCSPSQKYCSPGFDFDEKLSVIFNKATSLACASIDKIAVQSPQGCVNFQLVPRLFPKDGRFGPYFKISTCGDIATVAPYATLCPCLHMENNVIESMVLVKVLGESVKKGKFVIKIFFR